MFTLPRSPSMIVALLSAALVSACSTAEKSGAPKNFSRAADCAGASLALPDDVVVGTLDGKAITAKDLGPEVASAERRALYSYCDSVHQLRAQAFDNVVSDRLVERAAQKQGQSGPDWMRNELQKRSTEPSEQEIQAFYDARKRPGAPPLDAVRAQVAAAIQQEKGEEVVRGVLDELKREAVVARTLPDVRSPPRELGLAEHTPRKGGTAAKVKVVEFADFQCPYCAVASNTAKEIVAKYGDKVELSYRHFPLKSIHPDAARAAEFAQCAAAQGKFWETHDAIYAAQRQLDAESLRGHAKTLAIDEARLDACLASGKAAAEVEEDLKKGEEVGVEGTPTFFVNGRTAPASLEGLSAAIDAELAN